LYKWFLGQKTTINVVSQLSVVKSASGDAREY
jgi:hypothetical protein